MGRIFQEKIKQVFSGTKLGRGQLDQERQLSVMSGKGGQRPPDERELGQIKSLEPWERQVRCNQSSDPERTIRRGQTNLRGQDRPTIKPTFRIEIFAS